MASNSIQVQAAGLQALYNRFILGNKDSSDLVSAKHHIDDGKLEEAYLLLKKVSDSEDVKRLMYLIE